MKLYFNRFDISKEGKINSEIGVIIALYTFKFMNSIW